MRKVFHCRYLEPLKLNFLFIIYKTFVSFVRRWLYQLTILIYANNSIQWSFRFNSFKIYYIFVLGIHCCQFTLCLNIITAWVLLTVGKGDWYYLPLYIPRIIKPFKFFKMSSPKYHFVPLIVDPVPSNLK